MEHQTSDKKGESSQSSFFSAFKRAFGNKKSEPFEERSQIASNVFAIFSPGLFTAYKHSIDSFGNIVDCEGFDKSLPTVIYIHGWLEDGEECKSVMAIRSAYRNRGGQNFISIDWKEYSQLIFPEGYKRSIKYLKIIAEEIAKQLDMVRRDKNYDDFYLVGHSLGGQCAGYVGREVQKISNNEFVISKIYALDAAGPGFEFLPKMGIKDFKSISKTDAKYVHIIHTNGGGLGIKKPSGHADFYPNGGEKQPGLTFDFQNHQRSWVYFVESIGNHVPFYAAKCNSYEDFCDGIYEDTGIMGLGDNQMPIGTFYLKTHSNEFAASLGEDGMRNRELTILINCKKQDNRSVLLNKTRSKNTTLTKRDSFP